MSRRFQFSLKWLFVAVLIVGVFLAGRHLEHRQRMLDREHYAASLRELEAENATLRQRQSNPFLASPPGSLRIRKKHAPDWQREHAEAIETRGFDGAMPTGK